MKVAILGASSTGKTELSTWLDVFLRQQHIPMEVIDGPTIDSHDGFGIFLLCGLDLHTPSPAQIQEDQRLRGVLTQLHKSFQVVYGKGPQRADNALYCLAKQVPPPWSKKLSRHALPVRWTGECEKCGDGDCEHQLFTKLIPNTIF